ncbi:Flagellar FliL protein [Roseivivax jejudonensis]|uniref:Flagellar protein FliL n=1 Tax=Roseivivax jejudonensis TaxID=1529041 RepID=A0A1X6ZQ59_9RHOB|nr:flagellar basal body-associated FliL family protein [Roseivivax jejudonensis]SLN57938.1 Flagellar FliL protein [Roseivivax jejudonensis]
MTDATADAANAPRKSSKLPLILGMVLGLAGGGGGYLAVSAGLLPFAGGGAEAREAGHDSEGAADHDGEAGHADAGADTHEAGSAPPGDFAFLELPPLVVSLGQGAGNAHLRFRATLEVPAAHAEEVRTLQPRVLDAMNGYLRALDPGDIEARDALVMIRAQLTRRVQLVLGREKLRDLLVLEFVLN